MSEQQKPSLGRIVMYLDGAMKSASPAIITRVHSDLYVNLTVFRDGVWQPESCFSVDHDDHAPNGAPRWFWPPRA